MHARNHNNTRVASGGGVVVFGANHMTVVGAKNQGGFAQMGVEQGGHILLNNRTSNCSLTMYDQSSNALVDERRR